MTNGAQPPPPVGPLIRNLIYLIIVGIVLYIIYLLVGMIIHGTILMLIGIVLVLIFLAYALRIFGIW